MRSGAAHRETCGIGQCTFMHRDACCSERPRGPIKRMRVVMSRPSRRAKHAVRLVLSELLLAHISGRFFQGREDSSAVPWSGF